MAQFALPLTIAGAAPERIVVSASNRTAIEALRQSQTWPFRTAILAGPPRSGKSLLARWFEGEALGAVIDDADGVAEADLFHRWNRAQAEAQPLLLVSSAPLGGWRIALPDLASRLGAALLLQIEPPDDAMIAQLIAVHAAQRGLALGEGAAAWLMPRIERSHAAIEALVAEIDRLSLERKQPVTISLLRDALAPGVGEQPRLL